MSEPRPYTQEEMREMFLDHIWTMIVYWAEVQPNTAHDHLKTVRDRLEGLGHSFLCALDGSAMALPAFKLYADPHPEDEQYHKDEGENWWPNEESGVDVHGECMLHDLYYRHGRKLGVVPPLADQELEPRNGYIDTLELIKALTLEPGSHAKIVQVDDRVAVIATDLNQARRILDLVAEKEDADGKDA